MNIPTLHSSWRYVWKCQNILLWPLALFFPQSPSVCLNHYKNLRLPLHTGLGRSRCIFPSHITNFEHFLLLLWCSWLFAFWFVSPVEPSSWHVFCFFYCSHNTESYIWTGLMGFSVIPLLWCWPGQAAQIFWPLFSLLKQLFPPVTSGSGWKMVYVGLCVFQLGHCSERVQRCNREKCCNECWEALWCQRW